MMFVMSLRSSRWSCKVLGHIDKLVNVISTFLNVPHVTYHQWVDTILHSVNRAGEAKKSISVGRDGHYTLIKS